MSVTLFRLQVLVLVALAALITAVPHMADLIGWVLTFGVPFAVLPVLYGFHNLQDVLDQRAAEVQPRILSDAVELSRQLHNQEIDQSLVLLASRGTDVTIGYNFIGEGELQGVDEWGRPDPIRFLPPAQRWFPIRMAQASIGLNWVLSQKMTVQEVNDRLVTMFAADAKWMRRQLLAALFTNVDYAFNDPQYGSGLLIKGLANGDGELFIRESTGVAGGDTHHIGSATGTFAEGDLLTLRNEVVEHPENGGANAQVCVLLSTTPAAAALNFVNTLDAPDPNITLGTGQAQYVGSAFNAAPGRAIGYNSFAQVHLRQWDRLPDNYAVAITNAGDPPLRMREDEEASLRGFGEIPGRQDMPYLMRTWSRRAGFAGWNRVGAAVMRTNNTTYAIPSGYGAPQ